MLIEWLSRRDKSQGLAKKESSVQLQTYEQLYGFNSFLDAEDEANTFIFATERLERSGPINLA